MIVFALASVAWGKKPAPAPRPAPVPDSVAAEAEEAAACAADVPENYQIHTGYAADPDEAGALSAAIEDARRRALEVVCSGKSPTRCEVLARHVENWKAPYWSPTSHRACAHVGIRRDYLDDDKGDQQRLSAELVRLGGDIAARGKSPLWIEPPTWAPSGCHAGPAGSSMVAELKNALAAAGSVRLATQAESATRLHLALDVRATEVVVSADLREPGASSVVPLQGFTVPGDLFDLHQAGADCRLDQELGLVSGQRAGSDGRTVRVTLPAEGAYCEGDSINPVVVVDRPSRVKVYSVARDGTAFLVWPPPDQDGVVQSTAPLGEMELFRSTVEGDEKLVAVAVPIGGSFGPSQKWKAFCKVSGALTAAAWTPTSAAGAATFVVQRYDAPACLRRGVVQRSVASLPDAPICQ